MKTAPNTCVLQMLATHLVEERGWGGVLRGRAEGVQREGRGRAEAEQGACRGDAEGMQVVAHERVAEEVLLEE